MSGEHYNRYIRTNFSEINAKQYDNQKYENVYNKQFNTQFSVSQEPDIEYDLQTYYLCVSSKDRNFSQYPNVNKYTIHLRNEYKNVSTIELVQAILPAKNNVDHEPYLLLNIDEIEEVVHSNDTNIANSFAILQLAPPVTTNGFIQIDKRIHENTIKYFKTPKASLSKMSITITDSSGIPFDFGTDSDPPEKEYQNTFVFKIQTLEKKRSSLNSRNVF